MLRTCCSIASLLLCATFLQAQTVSLRGTVTKTDGTTGIEGVTVALVSNNGLSGTTDVQGVFSINGPVSLKRPIPPSARLHYLLAGNSLVISSLSPSSNGRVELYSCSGRKIISIPFHGNDKEKQRIELPESGRGLFILRIITPDETITRTIVRYDEELYLRNTCTDVETGIKFTAVHHANTAIVDTLIATKAGYSTGKVALDTYSKTGITISLDTAGPVACTPVDLPLFSELTVVNEKLPDPFTFYNGTKMTRKEQWECRRKEILDMASRYLYGPIPTEPDSVWGTVSGDSIRISCNAGTETADFSITVDSGSGDILCLNLMGGLAPGGARSLIIEDGAADKLQRLYGIPEILPLLAQAWLVDRVMEVLKLNPGCGFDSGRLMVTGCSGCGKGALLVGAYSHIPLTVIMESGEKGVASLRMDEWFKYGAGKSVWSCADAPSSFDYLEDNGICGPWFLASAVSWLKDDHSKVTRLPFDQHCLLACIAPRACLTITNQNGKNEWCHLAGTCEALSSWAAEPVWNALGVPDNFGFLMYPEEPSPTHCSKPESAKTIANEFFKRVFEGDTGAKTDVMIFGSGPHDLQQPQSEWEAMWVDWDMNTTLK